MTLLFVEDHPELIDEIVEIIAMMHPEWKVEIATDVLEAWQIASKVNPDRIIIDVMLPAFTKTDGKARSEGLYLALWFLGMRTPPPELSRFQFKRQPDILFLTSRAKVGVEAEWRDLVSASSVKPGATSDGRFTRNKVISRLDHDAYAQARTICYAPE
jgi:CheY-like chemotaxis protein